MFRPSSPEQTQPSHQNKQANYGIFTFLHAASSQLPWFTVESHVDGVLMLRLGFNQENHLGQGYKKIMLWLKITILLAANEARDVLRSHLKQLFFVVRKPGDALTCLFFKFFFFL